MENNNNNINSPLGVRGQWKSNFSETKKHYTDWWNGKGIVLTMWDIFVKKVLPTKIYYHLRHTKT